MLKYMGEATHSCCSWGSPSGFAYAQSAKRNPTVRCRFLGIRSRARKLGGRGPTLSHLGFDALFGLEYDSPISFRSGWRRVTYGFGVGHSPTGELYRAWEGSASPS